MYKKKLKIVHVVNELVLGGASKVVLDICNENYDTSIISLSKKNPLLNIKEWPKKVKVYTFNYQFDSDYSLRRYLTLFANPKITYFRSREIIECIHNLNPDILHFHLQPRELLISNFLSLPTTQFLFTDHLVRLRPKQYRLINRVMLGILYRLILRKFHVVAVAKTVFNYHLDYKLVSKRKKHFLIENKIDTEKFQPVSKSSRSIKVIYVARLEKRKGQDLLIEAWSKIKIGGLELILVGGGEKEGLVDIIKKLNPINPIIFTGSVENVLDYLQKSDIAVFPSYNEGLPLSLLEKMACGLPVIVSNIDEFKGIIVSHDNGLVYEQGNAQDLTEKIELLIQNPDLRKRLGANARRFVVNNYDLRLLKEEYESVYAELMLLKSE